MNILVSHCFLGEPCRYDGASRLDRQIIELHRAGHNLIPVCPELLGGLGVPRPCVELRAGRAVTRDGQDLDAAIRRGVELALEAAGDIDLAVLQSRSPTCGARQIYDGTFSGQLIPGMGLLAAALQAQGVPLADAGELAARRERVLLVDTDTQGNATSNLQLTEVPAATLTDVICGKGPSLADAVCRTSVEGLDLIRGGTLLAPALVAMQELRFGRDTVLRRLLPQIPDTYDYVFFDCSPSLESLFNINVLMAVQYILIPIKVDKNSIEGYDVMLETVREVRAGGNPDLRALGIFMTAVETGSSLDREMIANLPALLPELAFKAYIRKNIDVKKAPIALLPLRQYSPRCSAAQDYAALADEMLARMGG